MHSDKTGKTIAPESWKDGSQGKGDQTGVTGSPNGNGLGLSAEDIGNLENSHYNTLFDGLPKKRKTNEMITVRKTVTTIVEEPNPAEKVDETKHAVHQTDVNVIEARSQNLSKDTNERASAEQVDTIRRESLEQQESALRVSYERRLLENEERVAALESQLRECRQNGEQEE
jgi:hypothetical protein